MTTSEHIAQAAGLLLGGGLAVELVRLLFGRRKANTDIAITWQEEARKIRDELRREIQRLEERVEHLESENAGLRAENRDLADKLIEQGAATASADRRALEADRRAVEADRARVAAQIRLGELEETARELRVQLATLTHAGLQVETIRRHDGRAGEPPAPEETGDGGH